MKHLFLTIALCCSFIVIFLCILMGFRFNQMISRAAVTFVLSYIGSVIASAIIVLSLQNKKSGFEEGGTEPASVEKSRQIEPGTTDSIKEIQT
jgi:glucan phosphoethanolaminetransferase (alkaline phosphatase superfamily)